MALSYPPVKLSLDIWRRLEEDLEKESLPNRAVGKSTCFRMELKADGEVTV